LVLVSLCHDVGKLLSVAGHDRLIGEILKPFVSSTAYEVVRTHQEFQSKYWGPYFGWPATDSAERYRGEDWFDLALQFSSDWDQKSFERGFKSKTLADFEPLVRQFLSEPPW